MKKISSIKFWTNAFHEIKRHLEDLQVLIEFVEVGEGSEQEVDELFKATLSLIEDLEFKNMLSEEQDSMGAILKINPKTDSSNGIPGANR